MNESKLNYHERSDLEKLRSQWNKIRGLLNRKEWSAVIVRAATSAELAANFAIRREFEARSQIDRSGVDKLLFYANGLAGKIDKLLLPITTGTAKHKEIKALKKIAASINSDRNAIIHQGEFRNEEDVRALIENATKFVESLVSLYEEGFLLTVIRNKA